MAVVAVKLADIPDWVKSQIRVASFGDSSELRLGEQVVAIGNALGYGQSVTSGYISALNRDVTIDGLTNSMIQTDAAINGGNSGGALLNMNGEVIGINSAKTSGEGVEGMGYALPSNTVAPIVEELSSITTRERVTDSSEQGYMGITPEIYPRRLRNSTTSLPVRWFTMLRTALRQMRPVCREATSSQASMALRLIPATSFTIDGILQSRRADHADD